MSAQLSPIVSEFESEEHAARYDAWFRAKVQASLEDEMKSRLATKRKQRRNDR